MTVITTITKTAPFSQSEEIGKRNTDSTSRATTILEISNVYVPRHSGEVVRVFGFPTKYIFTDSDCRLRQESWSRRGLHIHYQYLPNLRGCANLIVSMTSEETREAYLRILDRLSKKPLCDIQEVLAS